MALAAPSSGIFSQEATRAGINTRILKGVCHYESDFGHYLSHHNENGSWDVGYCQNHRTKKTKNHPAIPSDDASIVEAADELAYWKKQHQRFCVKLLNKTGECGSVKYGKWRGVKNCKQPHPWWGHYNWGFRVKSNNYDKKIQCFMDNGFKRCKAKQWKKISF